MTKLTDTQQIILTATIRNKGIVPTLERSHSKVDPRAYGMAVVGLIKRGMLEPSGPAKEGEYAKEGRRLIAVETDVPADAARASSPAPVKAAKPARKARDEDEEDMEEDEEDMEEDEEDMEEGEQGEAEADEGDEDEEVSHSIVPPKYRPIYRENTSHPGRQNNGDAVARFLADQFLDDEDRLVIGELAQFAVENSIDPSKYSHLSNGQIRMNIGNRVRGLIRRGIDVRHKGKVVFEGERQPEGEEKPKARKRK